MHSQMEEGGFIRICASGEVPLGYERVPWWYRFDPPMCRPFCNSQKLSRRVMLLAHLPILMPYHTDVRCMALR